LVDWGHEGGDLNNTHLLPPFLFFHQNQPRTGVKKKTKFINAVKGKRRGNHNFSPKSTPNVREMGYWVQNVIDVYLDPFKKSSQLQDCKM